MLLERIQRRATKYILNDYQSDYKHRLLSLRLLPLAMQLELYDIMFFIRSLKVPDTSNTFLLQTYIHFCEGNTRSLTHLKLRHSLSKSNATSHLYFNRLPRLWNSLPSINFDHSIPTIKNQLLQVFWSHFTSHFQSTNPCSLHYCCPCAKCVPLSVVTNYSSN